MPKPTHDSKFVNEEGEKLRRNEKMGRNGDKLHF